MVALFIAAESAATFLAATPTGVGQAAALVIQLALGIIAGAGAVQAGAQAIKHAESWLVTAWTAQGDAKQIRAASKEFVHMLVMIAMAALAFSGAKTNLGKAGQLTSSLGKGMPQLTPQMVTPDGLMMGPQWTPGGTIEAVNLGTNTGTTVGAGSVVAMANGGHPWKSGAYHGKKPTYENPGHHDPTSPNFRGQGSKTSKLPADAESVYKHAIPDPQNPGTWYGRTPTGGCYRYQGSNGREGPLEWGDKLRSWSKGPQLH